MKEEHSCGTNTFFFTTLKIGNRGRRCGPPLFDTLANHWTPEFLIENFTRGEREEGVIFYKGIKLHLEDGLLYLLFSAHHSLSA